MNFDLKAARESKGMTREELAKKVGISPAYVGHLERGTPVHVSEKLVEKLTKALGRSAPAKVVSIWAEKQSNAARKYYSAYRAKQAKGKKPKAKKASAKKAA